MTPLDALDALCQDIAELTFSEPVTHVYNPLVYARDNHRIYLERFAAGKKRVVFLGMNPGPWGMAQSGIPFGDVQMVRDFLKIDGVVQRPAVEHPKRPVEGLDCPRREISGTRLWQAIAEHFSTAERFFAEHFVANYCPLSFMEASGRNRIPEQLKKVEREPLFAACDQHLRRLISALEPEWVIGVGNFAEARAKQALGDFAQLRVGRVLHPSPASPAANANWQGTAKAQLVELGICL